MAANAATCKGVMDGTLTVGADRTYRVEYRVETTEVDDQLLIAISAPGIPAIGENYQVGNEADVAAFVDAYSGQLVEQDGHRKYWAVYVTFSTRPRAQDDTQPPVTSYEFPWLAPARVSGSGTKQEVLSRFHYPDPTSETRSPVTSSAGELYDDVYREESTFGLRIEMDFQIGDWELNDTLFYVDCLNDAEFWGAPSGYYRLGAPQYQLLFTGQGIPYWAVVYEFEGKYGGWNGQEHVDEGTYYREVGTGKRRRFEDDWRLSFAGKGKLDGTGTGYRIEYEDAQDRTEYWPSNGINEYREVDFTALRIPTNITEVLNGRRD